MKIILLIAMLVISSQSKAWIAYGFKSGMSRFDVGNHLSANESLVITEGEKQTYAGPSDNRKKYNLVYCARPHKLYLMQFSLPESYAAFVKAREKYEKRYGIPDRMDYVSDDWQSEDWENVDISLIWDLNEFETIKLTHNNKGTSAEFRDLSVCQ